jgi:hypothetical protein
MIGIRPTEKRPPYVPSLYSMSADTLLRLVRGSAPDLEVQRVRIDGALVYAARFTFKKRPYTVEAREGGPGVTDPALDVLRRAAWLILRDLGYRPESLVGGESRDKAEAILEATLRGDAELATKLASEYAHANERARTGGKS